MRPALVVEASRMTARIITWHNCISRTIVAALLRVLYRNWCFSRKSRKLFCVWFPRQRWKTFFFGQIQFFFMENNFLLQKGGVTWALMFFFCRENTLLNLNLREIKKETPPKKCNSLSTKFDDFSDSIRIFRAIGMNEIEQKVGERGWIVLTCDMFWY